MATIEEIEDLQTIEAYKLQEKGSLQVDDVFSEEMKSILPEVHSLLGVLARNPGVKGLSEADETTIIKTLSNIIRSCSKLYFSISQDPPTIKNLKQSVETWNDPEILSCMVLTATMMVHKASEIFLSYFLRDEDGPTSPLDDVMSLSFIISEFYEIPFVRILNY